MCRSNFINMTGYGLNLALSFARPPFPPGPSRESGRRGPRTTDALGHPSGEGTRCSPAPPLPPGRWAAGVPGPGLQLRKPAQRGRGTPLSFHGCLRPSQACAHLDGLPRAVASPGVVGALCRSRGAGPSLCGQGAVLRARSRAGQCTRPFVPVLHPRASREAACPFCG